MIGLYELSLFAIKIFNGLVLKDEKDENPEIMKEIFHFR